MELTVVQKRLAKALAIMSRVALNSKTGLPILNNVLLRAEDNQLTLTATNLELATVSYLNAKIEKEGTITVPARLMAEFVANLPKDDDVKITVKDHGTGISCENLGKIFDKFARIENHLTSKTQGSGLGLYIVKNLVEKMNGTITVQSSTDQKDHGTIFTILLPAASYSNQCSKKIQGGR